MMALWKRLSIGAVAVLAILLLIEAGARLSVGGVARLPGFFSADWEGDYQLEPGHYRYWHRDRAVEVTIGDDRRRVTFGAPAEAGLELWLIGDSQVFGWGLGDDETIAARLQLALGDDWRVVNAGVPGNGPAQYAQAAAQAPENAVIIVFFTEMNDGQDAYLGKPYGTAHCGILVVPGGIGQSLPCWLMASHLFSTVIDLRNAIAPALLAPSLNCHPQVRSASTVIASRITRMEQDLLRRPGLVTASIPWDARLLPHRLGNYRPRLDRAECAWDFPDALALAAGFAAQDQADHLFQRGDHHLSVDGAQFVANHIAGRLMAPVPAAPSAAQYAEGPGNQPENEEAGAQQD